MTQRYSLDMAVTPRPSSPDVARLVAERRLRPAKINLSEYLAERGPLTGPITRDVSNAILEERAQERDAEDRG
jgi:hypothetical protein